MNLSNPLKRGIQTTEFWLVVAADVALAVVSTLHGGLSVQHAAQYGTELNGVYVIARAIPKGLLTLNGLLGVSAPDVAKAETVATAAAPVVAEAWNAERWLANRAPEAPAKPAETTPAPDPTPSPSEPAPEPTPAPATPTPPAA